MIGMNELGEDYRGYWDFESHYVMNLLTFRKNTEIEIQCEISLKIFEFQSLKS